MNAKPYAKSNAPSAAGSAEEIESVKPTFLTLTTQSSETGRAQTALLSYCKEGDSYVVAATSNQQGKKPPWFLSLKKEPMVQLEIEGVQFCAQAKTPTGRERINLLPKTKQLASGVSQELANKIPRITSLVLISPMW